MERFDSTIGLFRRVIDGRGVVLLVVLAVAAACSSSSGASGSEVAPDFELTLFGNQNYTRGQKISLSQFRGQPVVINFWYPSCPPCVKEMPDFNRVFNNHRGDKLQVIGVQVVGFDSAEEGQAFIQEHGISYALGPDMSGELVKQYKVVGFPTTVFVDRDGKIVRRWVGFLDFEKMEELVDQLLRS